MAHSDLDHHHDSALEISLLVLRIGLAILFAVWAFDKLLNPEHAKQVLAGFYGQDAEALTANTPLAGKLPLALGIAQLAVVVLFLFGIFKTFSYGIILLMALVTTVVSFKMHLDPLGVPNILFWANWPILGGAFAMFMLRKRDHLMSVQ